MKYSVKVRKEDGKIYVTTPFSYDFVKRARNMSGKWSRTSGEWVFDAAVEDVVSKAMTEIYGTDGSPCEMILSILLYTFSSLNFLGRHF